MQKGLLVLNVILLISVGYLFYRQFFSSKNQSKQSLFKTSGDAAVPGSFRIAYFEIDSIDAGCEEVKDIRAEINNKQLMISAEIEQMDKSYREKYSQYQNKASVMTKVQSDQASTDLMQTQENIKNRKSDLEKEYNDFVTRRMQEVKSKIEAFLKEYNQGRKFAYIISYEPGLFYFKDTIYNITQDVVNGLNADYKKRKK